MKPEIKLPGSVGRRSPEGKRAPVMKWRLSPLGRLGLAVTLCLGLFLGSQSFSAPDKGSRGLVRLKVFSLPSAENMGVGAYADRAVLAAFNKRYPYIKVSGRSGIKVQGAAFDAGPLMAIAGGVSPDVIYVNFRQSDGYSGRDFSIPWISSLPGSLRKRSW